MFSLKGLTSRCMCFTGSERGRITPVKKYVFLISSKKLCHTISVIKNTIKLMWQMMFTVAIKFSSIWCNVDVARHKTASKYVIRIRKSYVQVQERK
jgi:predicted sulfurtransferase